MQFACPVPGGAAAPDRPGLPARGGLQPDRQSSSRPSATPMQLAMVAVELSGDSGTTWSASSAARVVLCWVMASMTRRSVVAADSCCTCPRQDSNLRSGLRRLVQH